MLELDTELANAVDEGAGTIVRDMMTLADWRRRLYELYATIRATADPAQAWRLWRNRRDALLRDHPQSPFSSSERAVFNGLPYFHYDPALRHLVDLEPIERDAPETQSLRDDGQIRLHPFARTRGLARALGGELIVYWMIMLSLLDLVAALVTVSMEEESLTLVPMALLYRFVFILFLDVVKTFATLEELFRLDMGWAKLQRVATAPG